MLELEGKIKIDAVELEQLLEDRSQKIVDFILIDVREQYECEQESIVGVDYFMPMSNFYPKSMNKIEKHKEDVIILQCKSGGRSLQIQRLLIKSGFKKTINMEGGITAYSGLKK